MKNSQKGFANIILIVAVVVLVGALGYVALVKKSVPDEKQSAVTENTQNISPVTNVVTDTSTRTDETTGWKTHVNKEIGFSFKYPQKWTAADGLSINTCCLDLFNLENFNQNDDPRVSGAMKAQFGYSVRTPQLNKQEFINKLVLDSKKDGEIPMPPIKESSIASLPNENGLDVIKFEGGCCGGVNYIIPIKKDFSEMISVSVWRQDPLFEKVLSTFKFTTSTKQVSLPTTCVDKSGDAPVITSISPSSGLVGTKIEIRGCNLSGFEGDRDAVFVRNDGAEIALYGGTINPAFSEEENKGKLVKITLQSYCASGSVEHRYSGITSSCKTVEAMPGNYKVYVTAWGKKSNEATFTIK